MTKTCPSCGYSHIGPFIDNCPMCAEPVRNVRSDRGMAGSVPPWIWWCLGGLLVAVVLAGWWGFEMAQELIETVRPQAGAEREADRQARIVVITAAQLLQEFQDDPVAADLRYRDKSFELTGVVERQGRFGGGVPFVILHAGDDNAKVKIECYFDGADAAAETKLQRLTKGQSITVSGEYDGQASNLQVGDCVLLK